MFAQMETSLSLLPGEAPEHKLCSRVGLTLRQGNQPLYFPGQILGREVLDVVFVAGVEVGGVGGGIFLCEAFPKAPIVSTTTTNSEN